jgi:NADH-quinone oxidoreductase subunit H
LGLCVIVPVLICGTLNLTTIGEMQAGGPQNWLIFHDPFTFCIFWVYFTCGIASVNRAPFDLAEAESELVAGFHTEYSGLRWSIFFMAEYCSMFTVSMLAAILFFGGWNGPIPLPFLNYDNHFALGLLGDVLGATNVVIKATLGVVFMMWVRWTLPRLRIDQVITTCLKYCVPLAAVCFIGATAWQIFRLPTPTTINRSEVRESWARRQLDRDRVAEVVRLREVAAQTIRDTQLAQDPANDTRPAAGSLTTSATEDQSPEGGSP